MGRLFDLNGGNKEQAVSINETARFVRLLSEDNKVPGHPPEALLCGRVGLLLSEDNKVPGHPPEALLRGRVGLLLSEDNKVPGHPPEALLRGRVGFLFTAAFLVFLATTARTRVVSARLLFDTNSL